MLNKIRIQINGIHCKSCKSLIESEVEVLPGIESIDVNNKTGKSYISYDDSIISEKKIFKAIENLNYSVEIINKSAKSNTKPRGKIYTIAGSAAGIAVMGLIMIVVLNSGNATADKSSSSNIDSKKKPAVKEIVKDSFLGDKGENVVAQNNKIVINESTVSDGNLHAYNYYSSQAQKNIYFFVLKAPDGTYRAAANACEVCFGAKKGFSQQGDLIRCDNCRVTYPKSKIALEKGGCNPGPIDKNVAVNNGNLEINLSDLEAVSYLF